MRLIEREKQLIAPYIALSEMQHPVKIVRSR